MTWSIATARARFSALVEAAGKEPQIVSNRGHRVAVVVAADEYAEFEKWRQERPTRTLGEALDDVRRACKEDHYELPVPPRRNRANRFAE